MVIHGKGGRGRTLLLDDPQLVNLLRRFTAPNLAPAWRPSQSRAAPTIANKAMPTSGLGSPNASAGGMVITDPHDRIGLMPHDGT